MAHDIEAEEATDSTPTTGVPVQAGYGVLGSARGVSADSYQTRIRSDSLVHTKNPTKKNGNPATRRKPPLAERKAAKKLAEQQTEKVEAMTPDERRKILETIQKDLLNWAPPLEAAGCDLLLWFNVIGAELVRRYWPSATSASVYIARSDPAAKAPPTFTVMLPLATKTNGVQS